VVRMRTGNRTDDITLPSLTPVWRSAEFQEREAVRPLRIVFDGHPDLRRILMWRVYRLPDAQGFMFLRLTMIWKHWGSDDTGGTTRGRTKQPDGDIDGAPSTHRPMAFFRMDVRLDGERVMRLKRSSATCIATTRRSPRTASYLAAIPYTDRLDYLCSID